MKKFVLALVRCVAGVAPRLLVKALFGNIWRMRVFIQTMQKRRNCVDRALADIFAQLSLKYWESYGSWVGTNAIIDSPPTFPHGPVGFFCSNNAHIGANCVIFQHVTIGSNTLKDSKNKGAPHLEECVYVGCGAKIIGNVRVGRNARIGANCVVVKDVPENSVTVIRCVESIVKKDKLDNEFMPGA